MKNKISERTGFSDREMYPALLITVAALLIAAGAWFLMGKPSISACWFYNRYHIYCPACGCTRSLIALVQGRLLTALYYNPAVPLTAGLISLYLVTQTVWRLRGRRGCVVRYHDCWFPALFFLLIGNCILRNVLWWCYSVPL